MEAVLIVVAVAAFALVAYWSHKLRGWLKIQRRVDRGAELLDARSHGWWRRVNTETLDILSRERCVLGQVYGSYGIGKAFLDIDSAEAADCGFLWADSEKELPALNAAWAAQVEDRVRDDARERVI